MSEKLVECSTLTSKNMQQVSDVEAEHLRLGSIDWVGVGVRKFVDLRFYFIITYERFSLVRNDAWLVKLEESFGGLNLNASSPRSLVAVWKRYAADKNLPVTQKSYKEING